MSLYMTGGRVHVTGYDRSQGACHWIAQEADCMSLKSGWWEAIRKRKDSKISGQLIYSHIHV